MLGGKLAGGTGNVLAVTPAIVSTTIVCPFAGSNRMKFVVVTTTNFILFDPANGQTRVVDTIAGVTAKTLPVPPANFPPNIVAASLNVSADNFHVYGLTDTIRFHYNVLTHEILSLGYTSSPSMGPRVVSVSRDGSLYSAGWGLFSSSGLLVA